MVLDPVKWNKAVRKLNRKQDNLHRKKSDEPDITLDLYFFQCWECDEKYLSGEFYIPALVSVAEKIKCPRHPNQHKNIEYMGKAKAEIKWDTKK